MEDPDDFACDFASIPPHPLIYASLKPRYPTRYAKRMDFHKPKKKYTVGRGPLNDFVLDDEQSGQIDWLHGTITFRMDGNVCINDNHTTNGIWVNNRRLDLGETWVLNDGDSVRFGMSVRSHCKWPHVEEGYMLGLAYSYTFHSFVERTPPGISPSDERLRGQLQVLERARVGLEEERARLEQSLKDIGEESRRIIESMPVVPPTKPDNTVRRAQASYDCLADCLREDYPDFFPEDVCNFRPQPWLLPIVGPEENLVLHEMHRSFGVLPNKRPPPLAKDSPMRVFTRALHIDDAPDWNDPEVRWGSLQALNLSTPLTVPPSIIFWSMEHRQPVYMHPNFVEASRKGPYAHPYAISECVFSDESAARHRSELGLPSLEDPSPLRPSDALGYRISDTRSIPDEQELAEWVALLHGEHASSRDTSPKPSSPKREAPPTALASVSSKRPRVSDVDIHSDERSASELQAPATSPTPPTGHDGSVTRDIDPERATPLHSPSSAALVDIPARPSSLEPSPEPESKPDLGSSRPVVPRPSKRRKISRSPTPTSTAGSSALAICSDNVKDALRASLAEPLIALPEPPGIVPELTIDGPETSAIPAPSTSSNLKPSRTEYLIASAVATDDAVSLSPTTGSHAAATSPGSPDAEGRAGDE